LPTSVFLNSIGTAVPPHKISQELHYRILESANGMSREQKLHLHKIYSHSGIQSRHSVLAEFGEGDHPDNLLFHPANHHQSIPVSERMRLFELYAADLCEQAAKKCFEELYLFSPSEVTHLITFSCTGMFAPGIDIQLVDKLGLNRNVERTCINFMGCYAGINALKTAYHIIRSQPDSTVLLAGVELCTLHFQKNEKQDQLVANALFADGASASIVSAKQRGDKNRTRNFLLQNFYSEFEPAGKNEMVWRIGDYGFDLKLSAYIPSLIKRNIYSLVKKLFLQANIRQADIHYYALHPGGIKILQACEEALNISEKQNEISYEVLREYGNMSSVTLFFVLKKYFKILEENDVGKKILTCAFGPGLTMETMIAEIA
jgi:alpha-pyrone synthase